MKRKIFVLLMFLIFISSISFVFAANDVNATVQENTIVNSSNDDIINQPIDDSVEDVLGADSSSEKVGLTATNLTVVPSDYGIIESSQTYFNITLTDENGSPLPNTHFNYYINGEYHYGITNIEGMSTVTITEPSGFYYVYFIYPANSAYAASQSELFELCFANDNTLTDLAVRIECAVDVLNLTKDFKGYGNNINRRNVSNYTQVLKSYDVSKGIEVTKDLVINGNGHTVEAFGNQIQRCFFRNYNNLSLNNMSFINGYTNDQSTPLFGSNAVAIYNLNHVTLKNLYAGDEAFVFKLLPFASGFIHINVKNSSFINNGNLFSLLQFSSFESCYFINNSEIFKVDWWYSVSINYNVFLDNNVIFKAKNCNWELGNVLGNYWGTNNLSYINTIIPRNVNGNEININERDHTFIGLSGNTTFCEDDTQDYEISLVGKYASKVPTFDEVISYSSVYSTINATNLTLSTTPTIVRVSPKTYGVENLTIGDDLYQAEINITKSPYSNYNVTVNMPETEYSIPLLITLNVTDENNNAVNTTANVTVNGTTYSVNITDGAGTLSVENLTAGTYEVIIKIISNMEFYRNTTLYLSANITKASVTTNLSCNNTTSLAREDISLIVNTKNSIGQAISANVYIKEDGVEVGSITTDREGNAIFHYYPEAGNHTYIAVTHNEENIKASQSIPVNLSIMEKIPTMLSISSDRNVILDINQKANITVRLVNVNNTPIRNATIKLLANDVVVNISTTDDNGECGFLFTNSSGIYYLKAVYGGNLTYYDNSSEIVDLIISTGSSFFDLSLLINMTKENGVLRIGHDFTFDEELDGDFINGVPIDKNIFIEGGNFTINALNKARIFNINARNASIDNLNFVNSTSTKGGAILFDGDELTVSNSKFCNNTVNITGDLLTDSRYYGGGAIYSTGLLNVINSTFYNNKFLAYGLADLKPMGGGAIFTTSSLNVVNSIFDSNVASNINSESSISSGSSIYSINGNLIVDNSSFTNGISSYGGAIYYENFLGALSIYNSIISNNSGIMGGAIHYKSSNTTIINTTFENNMANDAGAILSSSINLVISSSKFINNRADYNIIRIDLGNNLLIEKSLFINNNANSSIIYYKSQMDLNNTYNVFVNNTVNDYFVIYYEDEGSTNNGNQNYNYWGNNTPDNDAIFNYDIGNYDYITIEIMGENITYTTIPTEYIIKFNGTNSDKLPDFETLLEVLSEYNITIDKSNIVINGSGAKVVLISDNVQNITLIVGPEYNVLLKYDIIVEQLIKKNYTASFNISGTTYGETLIVSVGITDVNGNGINGSLAYSFDGNDGNATVENGVAIIPFGRYNSGEYNISIIYNSTDLFYNDLTANTTFNISKAYISFDLNVTNITYGEDEIITAIPPRGTTGNYTFYIENILNETVVISMGRATYTLNDLPAGNYTVLAIYNGNENINPSNVTKNFTVSKLIPNIEIEIADVNYGDEIIAYVSSEDVAGNLTVIVNNKTYIVNIVNNIGNVTIDKLDVNEYNATVIYDGNSNITESSNYTTFNVFKASVNMSVDISESIYGQNTTITAEVRQDVSGNITFIIDEDVYEVPIVNATASVVISNLTIGNHTVYVSYPGSDNFNSSEYNATFATKSVASQIIVTSSDIHYGEELIVNATVTPGATGNVTFTVGNVSKSAVLNNSVATVAFANISAGTYNITAKYLGDEIYIASSNTTNVTVLKADSFILVDVGAVVEGENVVITFTGPGDASGIITVEIPGLYSSRNRTLSNGVNVWTISPLKSGIYTVNVTYNGDDNYLASTNSTVMISRYYPSFVIDVDDAFVGDDYNVSVVLNDTATGSVLFDVDGALFNVTLDGGRASVGLTNLTEGNHSVVVVYSGDEYYYNASGFKEFAAKSLISSINVTASDIHYGDVLVVSAVVTSGATGNVTFTVGNVSASVVLNDGVASANFTKISAGVHNITAKYCGDNKYVSSSNMTNVTVLKADSFILIDVGVIVDGENVAITFTAPDDASGIVTIEIPGLYSSRNRTLNNGVYVWMISPLKTGLYTVNVYYNGDNNYLPSNNSTSIDYNRTKTALTIDSVLTYGNVRLLANLTAEDGQLITAWVNVTVENKTYRIPVYNGSGYLDLGEFDEGIHQYSALYAGSRYFVNSTYDGSFEVPHHRAILEVPDVIKYFHGSERLYAYLKDNYGTPITGQVVTFNINGVNYSRTTDNNGTASLALGLSSGIYKVYTQVNKSEVFDAVNVTSNVTILQTINASDITKIFRNGTQYYATFRDSQGNYLADGTIVNFNINGVFYERKVSGDEGLARLNINLVPNEYIITAINPVSGEQRANLVTVLSQIESGDLTKYYMNDSQFVVRVLNPDGSYAGAGETVRFNINGVFYTRTTNETGHARLNINLNPGEYIITTMYGDCVSGNTVKVLPTLIASDLTMRYRDGSKFTVKLVDGKGSPRFGETIQFNINGVLYNRETDADGLAKLNINLVAGEYIITSSYDGASISNKITITQ